MWHEFPARLTSDVDDRKITSGVAREVCCIASKAGEFESHFAGERRKKGLGAPEAENERTRTPAIKLANFNTISDAFKTAGEPGERTNSLPEEDSF